MNGIRLAISVEGDTELEFVNNLIYPYLLNQNIYVIPMQVKGNVSLSKIIPILRSLANNFDFVTTLYDYYGFKKKGNRTVDELEREIEEQANKDRSINRKIILYLQQYEFEALLFSQIEAISSIMKSSKQQDRELQKIRQQFDNPELINDCYDTCPSRRLQNIYPNYDKIFHGIDIAEQIGLETMRNKCPRFDNWMWQLEALKS